MRKRNGTFSGFGKVFSFTFRHQTEGKGFKFATFVVPFILCGLVVMILALVAYNNVQKNNAQPVNIQKIYVVDETPYGAFNGLVGFSIKETDLKDVEYKAVSNVTTDEFLKDNKETLTNETGWGILSLSQEKKNAEFGEENTEAHDVFMVRLTLPSGSEVNKSTRNKILELGTVAAQGTSATASMVTSEQYTILAGNHSAQIVEAGKKEENFILVMVRYIAPFIFTILMYSMLLIYCMGMGKNLVVEKSSKLMETLLTSISPVALVAGKVAAIICVALMQFALWIGSVFAGFFIGNIVAKSIDASFTNPIGKLIDLLVEYGHISFTPTQILLALLALVFGFSFYCLLAAVIASTCAKAEEVAQKQGILNLFIIGGYMLAIMAAMNELNSDGPNKMLIIADMVPIAAAFRLPVDVLLGSISNMVALLSIFIMAVLCVALAIVAGKVYKAQVFLAGNSIVANAKRALFSKKKSKE